MFSNISQYTRVIRELCWKHRSKIIIGASVAAGVALLYGYSGYLLDDDEDTQVVSTKAHVKSIDNKKRAEILRRIRKENDTTMKFFLTSLQTKLNEVIDIASLTRQIRALRDNSSEDTSSIEIELWETLKVSSFTSVFVSIYLLSVVTLLVLVQRHMLATRLPSLSQDRNQANMAIESGDILDLFPTIITKSYEHLFNHGIQVFSDNVRNIVQENLKDWSAGNKLEVDFHELVLMILSIRRSIDADLQLTIKSIIIPEDVSAAEAVDCDEPARKAASDVSTKTATDPADVLLNQTWDVVELPLFRAALKEALDRCFENFFVEMRRSVFAPGNPTGHAPLRKPPLASLLPPLKTISMRLLDCSKTATSATSSQSSNPSERSASFSVWKDVANGVLLEELCVGVFDSLCNV